MLLGLPAAAYAAPSGGFIDIAAARTKIDALVTSYPSTFGGIMMWDAGVADTNMADATTSYGAAMKSYLRSRSGDTCGAAPVPSRR